MIIVRSPLRISLGGGGTDLPSYYENYEGFLLSAAINQYVYITVHKTFEEEMILKYSKIEKVKNIDQIEHPIIRETLRFLDIQHPHLEISSMADIPGGTGLGSSGSFTTALLKALHTYQKSIISTHQLAEQACHLEIDVLKEPIGKQDQFIAAYGGLTSFRFKTDGSVEAKPLQISDEILYNLEDNLLLFFTGYSRRAGTVLKEQDQKTKSADPGMVQNLHYVKELGMRSIQAIEKGQLSAFGEIMNEHWQYKKQRSANTSNPQIDTWYDLALKNGAVGGKLIGAGGGGFLMFYAHDKTALRHAMTEAGLREVRFRFDFEGTKTITHSS